MNELRNPPIKRSEEETLQALSEEKLVVLNSLQSDLTNNKNQTNANLTTFSESTETPTAFYGKGKRKRARAYAELKPGKGLITVNDRPFYEYFPFSVSRGKVLSPLQLTNTVCQYDVKLTLQGGGSSGQADAAIPAIAKALIKINPGWKTELAANLMLKHDPRNVEPKKPGRIKARKGYVYNRR